MADKPSPGMFQYLKAAFLLRWNLLLFGGAAAAAVISGHADVALPLVAAGELVYLTGVSSFPRFRNLVDTEERARGTEVSDADAKVGAKQRLEGILGGLDPERRGRFLRLRSSCQAMQGTGVRIETSEVATSAAELRTSALDRLLWTFLRLSAAAQGIERFLTTTDGAGIRKKLAELEARKVSAEKRQDERTLRSLADAIATAELRVANYEKAQHNAEYLALELDRIEQKIQALNEVAVSQQSPDALSEEVDAVAEGLAQTEETIRELESITGLAAEAEATPEILASDLGARR
ncbi:MAG: hypothetical protein IT373_37510 [Polyangiaceae bacterium]|nr:hypothetical protein [Polyangiaceae bacterium]